MLGSGLLRPCNSLFHSSSCLLNLLLGPSFRCLSSDVFLRGVLLLLATVSLLTSMIVVRSLLDGLLDVIRKLKPSEDLLGKLGVGDDVVGAVTIPVIVVCTSRALHGERRRGP